MGLRMRTKPFRREIEELVLGQQIGLELVVFRRFKLLIGRNTASAVNRPAAIGALHILQILGLGALAVVIVEERNVRIVALDQTTAGRVVMRGSEREPGVVLQRIDGLNQTFAERGLTQNPGA